MVKVKILCIIVFLFAFSHSFAIPSHSKLVKSSQDVVLLTRINFDEDYFFRILKFNMNQKEAAGIYLTFIESNYVTLLHQVSNYSLSLNQLYDTKGLEPVFVKLEVVSNNYRKTSTKKLKQQYPGKNIMILDVSLKDVAQSGMGYTWSEVWLMGQWSLINDKGLRVWKSTSFMIENFTTVSYATKSVYRKKPEAFLLDLMMGTRLAAVNKYTSVFQEFLAAPYTMKSLEFSPYTSNFNPMNSLVSIIDFYDYDPGIASNPSVFGVDVRWNKSINPHWLWGIVGNLDFLNISRGNFMFNTISGNVGLAINLRSRINSKHFTTLSLEAGVGLKTFYLGYNDSDITPVSDEFNALVFNSHFAIRWIQRRRWSFSGIKFTINNLKVPYWQYGFFLSLDASPQIMNNGMVLTTDQNQFFWNDPASIPANRQAFIMQEIKFGFEMGFGFRLQ